MKKLEYYLRPTQVGLFNLISKNYNDKAVVRKGKYILVKGDAPVMLLAHMDTVHKTPVKHICKSLDGNIIMSPEGIGGDDRCGVYALIKAHELSDVKPWLLFTCDEEVGGIGASAFTADYCSCKLPKELDELKFLIEIDRKGSKDAVYYDCANTDFEKYITSKGFVTAVGSFSDISIIAPVLGLAAVNLSSGYYNAHTQHEYINCKQLRAVIKSVVGIIAETVKPEVPRYEYIEQVWTRKSYWSDWDVWDAKIADDWKTTTLQTPDDLPDNLIDAYLDLLDIYSYDELEEYRKEYGDVIIEELHKAEFSYLYNDDDGFEEELA